jgi:hypothetical protein
MKKYEIVYGLNSQIFNSNQQTLAQIYFCEAKNKDQAIQSYCKNYDEKIFSMIEEPMEVK